MECCEEGGGGGEMGMVMELLEVSISSIIYLKGIYPSGAFQRTKYLNLVVHTPRHPQLRHYIHSSLSSLLPFLLKGQVDRVAVIFSNGNNVPVERFVFKLTINHSWNSNSNANASCSPVGDSELQDSLRSFLIKLPLSQPLTAKLLPQDCCRWEINAYFRSLPQGQGQGQGGANKEDSALWKWIPTSMKHWHQPPLITPIKSMNSTSLSIQLYLEHPNPSLSEPADQNVAQQLCSC